MNKITLQEFELYINNLKQFFEEQKKLEAVIDAISPTSTGVVEFGGKFVDDYIKVLSRLVDDDFDWVSWFVFENDFGKKGMEAKGSSGSKLIKIKTVKQLYNIIHL